MNGYRGSSTLTHAVDGGTLLLETALGLTPLGAVEHPEFFSGILARPDIVAAGLLTVADVASTMYYDLSAILSKDPVITASGDRLRFESFSACNGVSVRFDLLSSGIDSGEIGLGTTNVDVNQALRTALASVRRTELMHLGVGAEELRVSTLGTTIEERKVELPERWIRGFAQTSVVASGMTLALEATGAEAMRFVAGLPTGAPGLTMNVGRGARGLQQLPGVGTGVGNGGDGVRLAGTARLSSARRLLRFINKLTAYRHDSGASAWVFHLEGGRVTYLISPEPSRGFSGEGALLRDLAQTTGREAALVAEHLVWQPVLDVAELGEATNLSVFAVKAGLAELAASGKVGFDIAESAWFHRELPHDDERSSKDNPRLVTARRLVSDGLVVLDGDTWRVGNGAHQHWVSARGGGWECSCRWQARYAGSRGPCSHLLAVELMLGALPG